MNTQEGQLKPGNLFLGVDRKERKMKKAVKTTNRLTQLSVSLDNN